MEWNNYSENKQSPATAPVQQIWPPTENTMNSHGFGSPVNPQQQHYPTQPQNQNQYQVQYQYSTQPQIQPQPQVQESQPMVILQTGQNRNLTPVQSSNVFQMLTLGTIIIRLICEAVLHGMLIQEWVELEGILESNPPETCWAILDNLAWSQLLNGFMGILLGFSIVIIGIICAAIFGAVKKILCLLLLWMVLASIDITLQVFLLAISSLVLAVTDAEHEFSKYLITQIVESVVLIIFNVPCLIFAFLFCKQVNLEKSRRRQAREEARQGHRAIYSS